MYMIVIRRNLHLKRIKKQMLCHNKKNNYPIYRNKIKN